MQTGFFTNSAARSLRPPTIGFSAAATLVAMARTAAAALLLFSATSRASAKSPRVSAGLPDAPAPQAQAQAPEQKGKLGGTVGLLSRRSLFFPELAFQKGPLNTRQKLELAADESIAPSRFASSAVTAAFEQARNDIPGYGQGAEGYGKRYGSSMATTASANMFDTFLLPTLFRQDPRYFVRPNATFKQRVGNALRRVVVTRTDSGGEAFNVSGILGALMAEGLANSYLPDAERTTGKTFQRFGIRIGVGAAANVLKEYWPSIFRSLGMGKLAPKGSGTN